MVLKFAANPYPAIDSDPNPPTGGTTPSFSPDPTAPPPVSSGGQTYNAVPPGQQDVFGTGSFGDTKILLGWQDQTHQSGSRYSVDGGPGTATTTHATTEITQTANQYFQQFANMSLTNKAGFIAMQKQLIAAHAYGNGKPILGVYTTADGNAMSSILAGYVGLVNSNPGGGNALKFSDYLNMVIKNGGLGGGGNGGGPTRAPLQLTDPKELEQSLQQAAQNRLGRNLGKDELATFVDAFHAKEKGAYDAAGRGHTVTGPDVSGQALSQLDDRHAAEEGQRNMATNLDALAQLLGAK
jgi:hypothetical protein